MPVAGYSQLSFMTSKEFIKRNKAIAVWMGYEYRPNNEVSDPRFAGWWRKTVPYDPGKHNWFDYSKHLKSSEAYLGRSHKDLRFHSDWNRLMKVVGKIEAKINLDDPTSPEYGSATAFTISRQYVSKRKLGGSFIPHPEDEQFKFFPPESANLKILALFELVSDYCQEHLKEY